MQQRTSWLGLRMRKCANWWGMCSRYSRWLTGITLVYMREKYRRILISYRTYSLSTKKKWVQLIFQNSLLSSSLLMMKSLWRIYTSNMNTKRFLPLWTKKRGKVSKLRLKFLLTRMLVIPQTCASMQYENLLMVFSEALTSKSKSTLRTILIQKY